MSKSAKSAAAEKSAIAQSATPKGRDQVSILPFLSPLARATGRAGSVRRVPAAEVEARVGCAVREHLADCTDSYNSDLIRSHVVRVEVQADQLAIELKTEASSDPPNAVDDERLVLRVPWKKTPMKRRREIIVPASVSSGDRRPIRAETRVTLVASIARGRRWLDETSGPSRC